MAQRNSPWFYVVEGNSDYGQNDLWATEYKDDFVYTGTFEMVKRFKTIREARKFRTRFLKKYPKREMIVRAYYDENM